MTKTTPTPAPAENGKKKKILRIIYGLAALIAVYFIVKNYLYEGTDDAYVQAHALMLAPRIGGTIVKVQVNENDKVKAGQLLAQLDDQDYSAEDNQAVADQASVPAQLLQTSQDSHPMPQLSQDHPVSHPAHYT